MIPAQELVERGAGRGGHARGRRRLHRAGRGEQPRRRALRAEHDDDQRRAARAARSASIALVGAGPSVRPGGTGVVGADGVARDGGGRAGRRPGGAAGRGCLRPGRRPAEAPPRRVTFGLGPEETDPRSLEGVLSALSGAFGRARARDAVLAGFAEHGRGDAVSRQLDRAAALPRAADGRGQPGRARRPTGPARPGSAEPTIAPVARADGGGDLAPARLGARRRSRSRPAATR